MLTGALGYRVFACFAGAYFLSYGLRSVNAVIAPPLMSEFALSNAALGALSSAYFFAFALLQLPLGVSLDRYGSRRTNASLLLVAAVGCSMFALASDVATLWVARALIGVGVAGALMSALKGYRFWYPPQRQQQLAAWMLVAGTAGALTVTVPVQEALPLIGWRGVFWCAAALLVVASAAIFLFVPRDEEQAAAAHRAGAGAGSIWAGYGQVFREPYFWRLGLIAMLPLAGFTALQSLWAGPWFVQVLGLTPEASARALFVFNFVVMLGFLGLAAAVPWFERRGWTTIGVVAVGVAGTLALQLAIALVQTPWAWMLWAAMGLLSTCGMLVQPHVSMSFPAELTGRAYTALNLMVFVGMFGIQWLFGVSVDAFRAAGRSTPDAFSATMIGWIVVQLVPLVVLLAWRVRPPAARASVTAAPVR